MRKIDALCLAALLSIFSRGAVAADYPDQFWENDEQGWIVETKTCDDTLCAFLVGYKMVHPHPPGFVPRDELNPDPNRRATPLCGLKLIGGFKPARKSGLWDSGWVYDPESGRTYAGTITQIDADTVKLRGYIGIPLFGKTLILHRLARAPDPLCGPVPAT